MGQAGLLSVLRVLCDRPLQVKAHASVSRCVWKSAYAYRSASAWAQPFAGM